MEKKVKGDEVRWGMIGRKCEGRELDRYFRSDQPEFFVVYGRRCVGKTFLVKEFFNQQFSFYATGMANVKMARQLKGFYESLKEYGCPEKKAPADWFEAFVRLNHDNQSGNNTKRLCRIGAERGKL